MKKFIITIRINGAVNTINAIFKAANKKTAILMAKNYYRTEYECYDKDIEIIRIREA